MITNLGDLARPAQPNIRIRLSFSGHETFPFRYTWLPKGVQKIAQFPGLFNQEDAVVILGVGRNMVRSIRHWCVALRLIEPGQGEHTYLPSELGNLLFSENGSDPSLEDEGTLWLLHWILVSHVSPASTWHLAITQYNGDLFTSETLTDWLLKKTSEMNATRVTRSSLKRDVDVFIRTYAPSEMKSKQPLEDTFDCPLVELGLLKHIELGFFQFVRGPKPALPDLILAYSVIDFWNRKRALQRTLPLEDILYEPGSPGRAFKLSENSVIERLERLPPEIGIHFDDTAGRRMLLRQESRLGRNPLLLLRQYYRRAIRERGA